MRKAFPLLTLVLLGGCSEKGAVEDAVREALVDPDSAKFGEITIVDAGSGKMACATVNARNRMGGYTGDTQMVVGFDAESGEWAAIDDLERSHEACLDLLARMPANES